MTILRRIAGPAIVCLACLRLGAAPADEYGLKGAFVYNFIQFVEWPASRLGASDPLILCVLDDSSIARRFGGVAMQAVRGHAIRVEMTTSSSEAANCHVIFVPEASTGRMPELVARHRRAGLLLMSEAPGSTQATVNLVVAGNRLAFDLNLDMAASQDLRVSSKLIRLARLVSGGQGKEAATETSPRDPTPASTHAEDRKVP